MADERDSEALAALMVLAARLRDTASAVAARADQAARGAAEPVADAAENTWESADFGALVDFAKLLGESLPPELRERLEGSSREALLALRALIDWYLAKGEETGTAGAQGYGDPPS